MATSTENIVFRIEKKYGVQAIQSECNGLFYLQDEDKLGMGILTVIEGKLHYTLLTREQAKTLVREINDIYDMLFN